MVREALLKDTEIIKIVDRDDRSSQEIADLDQKGICVLHEQNLESYILDDEVIKNCVSQSERLMIMRTV